MKENKKPRLDEEALLRVLKRNKRMMVELAIRLAWQAGMTRPQIHALTWNQVSIDNAEIYLPTHTVPIHSELLECLKDHRNRPSSYSSEYVVLTDGRRVHPSDVHISRAIGKALDEEETLKDVTVRDLRSDFIIRAVEKHGKTYALKVGNISMGTLHNVYGEYASHSCGNTEEKDSKPAEIDEARLMEFLVTEGTSAVSMALWLVWKQQIALREVASLTWEQVDFEKNIIRFSDGESQMHPVVAQLLKEIYDSREGGGDPHVILSPKAKTAYRYEHLSAVIKTALVKKGLGPVNLKVLSLAEKNKAEDEKVISYLQEHPFITRKQADRLLGTTQHPTYTVFLRLAQRGKLVRVGDRYYLAGTVIPPEQHRQAICGYLKDVKSAAVSDIADLLHIEKRACAWILHGMVEEGLISLSGQIYSLSSDKL